MNNLEQAVKQLAAEQIVSWETARRTYAELERIQHKTLSFGKFSFEVQFNPERVRSTTAPEGDVKRPCFLCAANRPPEQKAIRWREYDILLNPYPIFNPHLTIPATDHIPQYLSGKTVDMLALAAELPDFVLTFNGAKSGASAPDHFHFQAVGKGLLPAEKELPQWKERNLLVQNSTLSAWGAEAYLRPAVVIEGTSLQQTAQTAQTVLDVLKQLFHEPDEAQFNALCWYTGGTFTVVIFPRTAHRPRQYYARDASQFLFSPGAIDMAGVLITVREEDYNRTSPALITDLFSQVVPTGTKWEEIKNTLKLCLAQSRK